jgi:hypothetical protein
MVYVRFMKLQLSLRDLTEKVSHALLEKDTESELRSQNKVAASQVLINFVS